MENNIISKNYSFNEVKTSNKKQYYAATIVNIICFCHGCALGWLSPTLPLLSQPDGPLDTPLTETETNLVASVACITGTIFTPIFGWVADRYGRKTGLLWSAIPYLLCWILKLAWRTSTGLIIARLLSGISGAAIIILAPMYCVEIASLNIKGFLGSLMIFSLNVGILFMYIMGKFFDYSTNLFAIVGLPVIFFILMYKLPESPSYLVKKKQYELAEYSLSWLRDTHVTSISVSKELETLRNDAEEQTQTTNLSVCYLIRKSPSTRKALFYILILFTLQVSMGQYAIMTFAQDIFSRSGTDLSPSTCSIIFGSLMLLGSILASSLIEKLGRKILIVGSTTIVALGIFALALFIHLQNSDYNVEGLGSIPVITLSLVVFSYSMGAGPVPYVLPTELFVMQVRSAASSIVLIWVWFLTFLLNLCFGPAVSEFGMTIVFTFFGIVSIGLIGVTIFCIPETKGKSSEESMKYYDHSLAYHS